MSPSKTQEQAPQDERARLLAQFAEVALDDAYAIREEMSALVDRRKANREQLRSLAAQGHLSDEQLAEVAELYPARAVKSKDDEDGAVSEPATEPEA